MYSSVKSPERESVISFCGEVVTSILSTGRVSFADHQSTLVAIKAESKISHRKRYGFCLN
jgi:hypothetical protein